MRPDDVIAAIALGIGATMLMDGWNILLRRTLGIRSLDYCLLGRWVRHMPSTFRHRSIAAAAQRSGECAAGWITHYSIGIALAVTFVFIAPTGWLSDPTLLPPLLFGLGTVAFPLLILQPALGLGIASARAPDPRQARIKSTVTHAVFGLGLYLSALIRVSVA